MLSPFARQKALSFSAATLFVLVIIYYLGFQDPDRTLNIVQTPPRQTQWSNNTQRHPIDPLDYLKPPTGPLKRIPKIQRKPSWESAAQKKERLRRLEAVRAAFVHTWEGYAGQAWVHDQVNPIAGSYKDNFGGWASTLVDSLDTLWIMGFKEEFAFAVNAIQAIDFSRSDRQVSVFETTIRFVGGLIAAYDVSGCKYHTLLNKAVELADFLYQAFDTSSRMPVVNLQELNYITAGVEASTRSSFADFASLSLEFTRLSQLTGNNKYYDAVQRINNFLEDSQNKTKIPGLWPTYVNLRDLDASSSAEFTLGAMADSAYEYLPKLHLLHGGRTDQTLRMYEKALNASKEHLFFKHMNPDNQPLLMSGTLNAYGEDPQLDMRIQHLTCFVGGMVGMGARILGQESDIETARQLTDTCVWAYKSMPSGVMPETYWAQGCPVTSNCTWNEAEWWKGLQKYSQWYGNDAEESLEEQARRTIELTKAVPGMAGIQDKRYLLRPEAVESVFYMYRLTGDRRHQDDAWEMFQAIEREARTAIAYAEVQDVRTRDGGRTDSMESFWTGETLKYLFLIFSDHNHISLDKYVFNTEAHPFLRPTR